MDRWKHRSISLTEVITKKILWFPCWLFPNLSFQPRIKLKNGKCFFLLLSRLYSKDAMIPALGCFRICFSPWINSVFLSWQFLSVVFYSFLSPFSTISLRLPYAWEIKKNFYLTFEAMEPIFLLNSTFVLDISALKLVLNPNSHFVNHNRKTTFFAHA